MFYRFAVRVPQVIDKALFRQPRVDQVDWLLLHQANQRILDAVLEHSESQSYQQSCPGNTPAASIPRA